VTVVESQGFTVERQLQGFTVLEKVVFMELWCPKLDDTFLLLMGGALKRCPNLMQLWMTSKQDVSEVGRKFMTSFVELVRRFSHVYIVFR
jgi:hypothetical protein